MEIYWSYKMRMCLFVLTFRLLILMCFRNVLAWLLMNLQISWSNFQEWISFQLGFWLSLIKIRIISISWGVRPPFGKIFTQFLNFMLFLANSFCFQSMFLLKISMICSKFKGSMKSLFGLFSTTNPQRSNSSQLLRLPQLRVGLFPAQISLMAQTLKNDDLRCGRYMGYILQLGSKEWSIFSMKGLAYLIAPSPASRITFLPLSHALINYSSSVLFSNSFFKLPNISLLDLSHTVYRSSKNRELISDFGRPIFSDPRTYCEY